MIAARRWRLAVLLLLAWPTLASAQVYTISPPPFLLAQNNAGAIINNACIWTYTAGTSTPATTYTTSTGTANTNPIRSDSAGRFTAYLVPGSAYKFVYESACVPPAHGTILRTADNISGTPTSAATVDIANATAGETISAGQCAYLSNGSGGKSAGQWYKCDSTNTYSSTTPDVGIPPSAIASGSTGTIRIAGQVTGLSALSVGSAYFLSTGGTLTTTPPTNARKIGQADSATSIILPGNPPLDTLYSPTILTPAITSPTFATSVLGPFITGCGLRLTLTSGTPVTTSDVTGAATVYAAPFSNMGWGAGVCAFYDGSATWTTLTFTETAIALGTITSGLPYDVFCYNNSGTMACELLAWTSGTARATALATQNGILVKTGATTRRYVGTLYTTSTTQTEDSATKRFVWNYYNRVDRPVTKLDATANWAYATATIRQANAGAGTTNKIEVVIGVAEEPIDLRVTASATSTGGSELFGIGEDTTTAFTSAIGGYFNSSASVAHGTAFLVKVPAVGYHYYSWNEKGGGATDVWYGNPGTNGQQTGLLGKVRQ